MADRAEADLGAALAGARRGDPAAFRTLYRDTQPRLLRYLHALVGDDAEDIASETWLQITRDLHTFHGTPDGFRGWAATIARHRALDHLRARTRRPPPIPLPAEDLATLAAADDTAARALDAVATRALAARRAELTEMLQDFTGRQEWGVKVYVEPLAVAARPACETGREWRWVTAEAWVEKIGQALSAIAVATRRHPSPDPVPGDQAGWLALHGAYLLSAERSAEFGEIVQALAAEHDALRADVTGPWPPYSFADRA